MDIGAHVAHHRWARNGYILAYSPSGYCNAIGSLEIELGGGHSGSVRSQQVLYFPGRDYTKFSIHEYDESTMEKLIEVPEWRMIGITHGFLMNRIDEFKADLLRWYPDQSDKINEAFAEHMPVFQEHDYYFLMNKKDRSYFIAILNLEQWKLYAIEVYF